MNNNVRNPTPAVIKKKAEWQEERGRQINAAFVRLPRSAMLGSSSWWVMSNKEG
jgi:hypothetical protein